MAIVCRQDAVAFPAEQALQGGKNIRFVVHQERGTAVHMDVRRRQRQAPALLQGFESDREYRL